MGPIGCPETSVRNYHCWLRNDPEERSSQLLRGVSLKSRLSNPLRISEIAMLFEGFQISPVGTSGTNKECVIFRTSFLPFIPV
jgi:hypothetical protein